MNSTREEAGHSANVRINLLFKGSTFTISHLGPDYIRLQDAIELAPCDGQIVMVIDGHESRWPVHLPAGVHPGSERIPVEKIP